MRKVVNIYMSQLLNEGIITLLSYPSLLQLLYNLKVNGPTVRREGPLALELRVVGLQKVRLDLLRFLDDQRVNVRARSQQSLLEFARRDL